MLFRSLCIAMLVVGVGEASAQIEPLESFGLKPLGIKPLGGYNYSRTIAPSYKLPSYGTTNHLVSPGGSYLGRVNSNKYDANSISNPYGRYGSKYSAESVNNPYGKYGSRYSSESARNPYTTTAPRIYGSDGTYQGKLSANKYDPESISNPYSSYTSRIQSSPTVVLPQVDESATLIKIIQLRSMGAAQRETAIKAMSSTEISAMLKVLNK